MNENQKLAFIGLANAIQEASANKEWHEEHNVWILPEKMPKPYSKSMLKNLCEYGLIRVWTVNSIAWAHYDSDNNPHTGGISYKIKITKTGWLYYNSHIKTVEKPCNLSSRKTSWGQYYDMSICKRHGRRHTKDERESTNNS